MHEYVGEEYAAKGRLYISAPYAIVIAVVVIAVRVRFLLCVYIVPPLLMTRSFASRGEDDFVW